MDQNREEYIKVNIDYHIIPYTHSRLNYKQKYVLSHIKDDSWVHLIFLISFKKENTFTGLPLIIMVISHDIKESM